MNVQHTVLLRVGWKITNTAVLPLCFLFFFVVCALYDKNSQLLLGPLLDRGRVQASDLPLVQAVFEYSFTLCSPVHDLLLTSFSSGMIRKSAITRHCEALCTCLSGLQLVFLFLLRSLPLDHTPGQIYPGTHGIVLGNRVSSESTSSYLE